MNITDLNDLKIKIAKEDIDIQDNNFLSNLYDLSDYNSSFEELDSLLLKQEYHKDEYALIWYVGFCNIIRFENIAKLPDITQIDSYNFLKAGLIKYFKGHFNLTNQKIIVKPYRNCYAFIKNNVPSIYKHFAIEKLLYWIYIYDKELFFNLHFLEKNNFYFLKLFTRGSFNKLEIKSKYIDFNCEDEFKNYVIFSYLIEPFLIYKDTDNPEIIEKINENLRLIEKININFLVKIILDFIRYNETTSIPVSFLKILKKNEILFFKTFKELEIYSIKELLSFLFLLNQNTFENEELFKLILKKIEILLSNDYITIDNYFWRNFLESMPSKYIPDIKKLLNNLVEDLIFRFELDKQIRNEKYSIEIKKYNQLNEFKIICDDLISISV